ncbi:PaaI family thioesterase [Enterococcus durans]|uniref:PaaI family thioesterase n=2 Tax=Enterococcus TaxID=1350 RepID=UPI00289D198A|nr:PaaI family thioesterase [Enterococcus durans]
MMNLIDYLKIETVVLSKKRVELLLSLANIHHQPFGYLHGGISGVLIETACSMGANQHLDSSHAAVGIELHVQHLDKARYGTLRVIATPNKIGRNIQFWSAEVLLDEHIMIANGTCTLAIKEITSS